MLALYALDSTERLLVEVPAVHAESRIGAHASHQFNQRTKAMIAIQKSGVSKRSKNERRSPKCFRSSGILPSCVLGDDLADAARDVTAPLLVGDLAQWKRQSQREHMAGYARASSGADWFAVHGSIPSALRQSASSHEL